MTIEHKSLAIDSVQFKFDESSGAYKFSGYASVFDGVDSYGDTIFKGAYTKTLKNRKRPVQLRWNHWGPVIGKWTKIVEDEKGLYVEGELTKGHSQAEDAYALMKHGAVTGMSIGYRVVSSKENDHGGLDLKEIDLVEISIVESPADINAQIGDVKSQIEKADSLKEVERVLRDAGHFSRNDATMLVSRIKSLVQSESEAKKLTPDDIKSGFQQFLTKL